MQQSNDDRDRVFWIRLSLSALIVTLPWAVAMVVYGMSTVIVMVAVCLSGIAMLLIWDGSRISRAVLGWLRGEPMRDPLSGMYNPEAWAALLESEEDRCRRYDLPASVVVVKVRTANGQPVDKLGVKVGVTVKRISRAHDVVACLAPDTYAVLAINSKEPNAESLVTRLRSALEALNVSASFSVASRHSSQSLAGAFRDAQRGLVPSS